MKTVFKYTLEFQDIVKIPLPQGAEVLCFQNQAEKPVIWCLVDPEEATHTIRIIRTFRMAGTSHPIREEQKMRYIGSSQFQNGLLVFHLFEILPQKNKE